MRNDNRRKWRNRIWKGREEGRTDIHESPNARGEKKEEHVKKEKGMTRQRGKVRSREGGAEGKAVASWSSE